MNRFLKKSEIRRSFERAAPTYDASAGLQKRVGEELLTYHLPPAAASLPRDPARLLNMGCGTGRVLNLLLGMYPEARFSASDLAMPMLKRAKERVKSRRAAFSIADLEALPFKRESFDMAVSNLAYQWALDPPLAFAEVFNVLKPGGILAFSTLGPMTFNELRESLGIAGRAIGSARLPGFMEFMAVGAVEHTLTGAGFTDIEIANESVQKPYCDLRDMLKTLRSVGASPKTPDGNKTLARGTLFKKAARVYRERFPCEDTGGITATYDVMFVTARRPPAPLPRHAPPPK